MYRNFRISELYLIYYIFVKFWKKCKNVDDLMKISSKYEKMMNLKKNFKKVILVDKFRFCENM